MLANALPNFVAPLNEAREPSLHIMDLGIQDIHLALAIGDEFVDEGNIGVRRDIIARKKMAQVGCWFLQKKSFLPKYPLYFTQTPRIGSQAELAIEEVTVRRPSDAIGSNVTLTSLR